MSVVEKVKEEDLEAIRKAALLDLSFLCRDMLGMRDWGEIHDELALFLRTSGRRKHIELARGHLKSSVVTKGWTIQQVLRNPNLRVLLANAVWDNSRKFLRSIQKYVGQGSLIESYFGRFTSDHWNQDECTISQRGVILDAPTWATTGIEKEQTSQHYDIIIADDLVARENVMTPEQRERVHIYYKDLQDLLEPDGTLIVIGTRWHQDDLYAQIIDENEEATKSGKPKPWDLFIRTAYKSDGSVTFPEKFSLDYLDQLRASKGPYEFCTPAETPILMSDWKTKPIEHVKVGDELIGFTLGSSKNRSRLVKTRVLRTFSKIDHVLRFEMESGRKVLCTRPHKWYTGRNDETHPPYAPAHVGSKLQWVCPVENPILSERERMDWSYLAGLFDGEGSTKSGGALTLTQCQSKNPEVHKEIGDVLRRLGLSYGTSVRAQGTSSRNDSPGNTHFWIRDSFRTGLHLIRQTGCAKASQIADRFLRHGKRWAREEDRVVDIQYDSRRTVYALETETGNYVAWGYASSNSAQYLNNPIDESAADFKKAWIRKYEPGTQHPASLYLTVDPALSLSADADPSAGVVAGQYQDRRIRVVDYFHKRLNPHGLVDAIFDMVDKWKLLRVGIETFAFQKTIKYQLQEEQRRRNRFFSIDELGSRRGGKEPMLTKEARIRRLQPYFEQGLVEIRADMKELEMELLAFPRGRYDDLIDALSYQLDYLIPSQNRITHNGVIPGSFRDIVRKHWNGQPGTMYERFLADLKEEKAAPL